MVYRICSADRIWDLEGLLRSILHVSFNVLLGVLLTSTLINTLGDKLKRFHCSLYKLEGLLPVTLELYFLSSWLFSEMG